MSHQYHLTEKILAVQVSDGARPRQFVYVPAGAVITVGEREPRTDNLVLVQWDLQTVLLFQQDLDKRAELIPEPLYRTAGVGTVAPVC